MRVEPENKRAASPELELVDYVPTNVTRAPVDCANDAIDVDLPRVAVAHIDPHFAAAAREHSRGVVDPALWKRAVSLADGDEAAAVAPYLRARATMLKLAQQRRASARPASPPPPPQESPNPGREPGSAGAAAWSLLEPRRRVLLFACAGVAAVALVVTAWTWPGRDASPVTAVPVKTGAAPRAPAPAPVAVVAPPSSTDFAAKVEDLRNAGNWNVLVLHAAEWTRKEPANAAGWAALSAGYAKLGQIDESFEAAKQAVALDGANPAHLRRLADAYVGLDRPADALVHVEKLLALDARDVGALAQAGTLYLALGRLPDARNAFDRALALDPSGHVPACGAVEVARRQGRTKDAEVLAKGLKDAGCGAAPAGRAESVPVPARALPSAARR